MPGELCPACGTDRTEAGCGCHPDVTETAVLPQIEGPPLVRPYVAQTDAPYDPAPLPIPAPPAHPPANRELGLFPLATLDAPAGRPPLAAPGAGGAARSSWAARARASSRSASPWPSPSRRALPRTRTPSTRHPARPPTSAPPRPPATSRPLRQPPARRRSRRRRLRRAAHEGRHQAPGRHHPRRRTPAAPVTAPAPVTTSAAPSPSPTPVQTLRLGYTGPELQPLQQRLIAAGCADSLSPGQYDWDTAQAVHNFQKQNRLSNEEWGAYTPATRAALTSGLTCGN